MSIDKKYDVAVIGAGPAGMMAAISAGKSGANVVLIEKNQSAGKKLLLTGGGRCNLANAEFDLRKLIANYGKSGTFLFHSFSEFGPKEVMEFFNGLGIKTKLENNGRMFPKSDKAQDVLNVLIKWLDESDVETMYDSKVVDIEKENGEIAKIVLGNGDNIVAKNYVIATGGKSYSGTGSTGDGYEWAAVLGHKINELSPELAPIKVQEAWIKDLAGISLKRAQISILQNNKKMVSVCGELLFTHFGVSGPAILNISGDIGKLLKNGPVEILLDLLSRTEFAVLEKMILAEFTKNPNRILKNCLNDFVPEGLALAVANVVGINPSKTVNDITKEERRHLVSAMKNFKLAVAGLLSIESGMITGGGVELSEIDHKTMRSKIVSNLFFAGEIVNVHGPTGGFNLLQCWSTGMLAGKSAANRKPLTKYNKCD